MKECSKCKEVKELSEFYKRVRPNNKIEYNKKCKGCVKSERKQYVKENKEKIKTQGKRYYWENLELSKERNKNNYQKNKEKNVEYARKYREENPEKIIELNKNNYQKNKEKRAVKCKEYRENNREKISKQRIEYYQINKESINEKQRERYQENKEAEKKRNRERQPQENKRRKERRKTDVLFVLKERLRSRTVMAFKKQGYKKATKTHEMLGVDWLIVKKHIERQFTEGMNWENRNLWHIDHVIPLSSATTEDELINLCHYTNLKPLWAYDNLKKSDTIIEGTQIIIKI